MGRHKLRILIVDDCQDTVDSTVALLRLDGFDLRPAYGSSEALKLAAEYKPHAVLLDMAMPEMDGAGLAKELRKLPGLDSALLICITGFGSQEIEKRVFESGCDHYFVKPVNWQVILGLLNRIELN
jgi:response regulator RpfG family c-di-GMP phosphodiesterase